VYFNLRNILPKSGTFPQDTLYMIIAVLHVTAHYNLETHDVIVEMSGSLMVLKVEAMFLSRYEVYASRNGVIFLNDLKVKYH